MKKINLFISILLSCLFMTSCQNDEWTENEGYLNLRIEASSFVNPQTRIVEEYNPERIAIKIVNASGETVKEIDDHTTLQGSSIRLRPGNYNIYASSYGFNGNESGFDIPYYTGSTTAKVETGKSVTAKITCTLANVKVTVNYDKSFIDNFTSAETSVTSKVDGIQPLVFKMNETTTSGYFPAGNLNAALTVVNKSGVTHTRTDEITNVEARDHYILNYKIADHGSLGGVEVEVDGSETTYTFTFNVSTTASTSLAIKSTNAWSQFAYVSGVIASSATQLDPTAMKFEYKQQGAESWNSITATAGNDDIFQGTITGLTPNTPYVYRMIYQKGAEEFASEEVTFTTEKEDKIPNLNFDNWIKNGKHWYASATYVADETFWDSGNEGANMLGEKNPTCPEENDFVKGKAAKLWSTTAGGQFAAGSLFTGDFVKAAISISGAGATLNFGRPFTERPSQLTGHFKYAPGSVSHTKLDNVQKGDRDSCFIYIALTDWDKAFEVNTANDKFVDFTSSSIIAYGELAKEKLSPEQAMDKYEEFTIDLKYRNLEKKPTHILIVCTSSKYGDYFTGSEKSVLLLDEFNLVYGEPVTDPKYIQ